MLTLITGRTRSGKSRFTQCLCRDAARVVYIATALPSDPEMETRIAIHRQTRPAERRTIEEPLKVPEVPALHAERSDIALIDCVTIWLSNLESSVGRRFRDIQDLVNQKLALASESVYFLVSGIPMRIKPGIGLVQ